MTMIILAKSTFLKRQIERCLIITFPQRRICIHSFMLDKEPSNLKAIRGLLLANNKVNRLYDITRKMKNGTFILGTFNINKYRNNNDPDTLRFFEKTDRILTLYKEYVELKKNLNALETEADTAKQKLREGNSDSSYSYESNDALQRKIIVASVIFVLLVISVFAFGTDYATPAWSITVLAIATAYSFIVVLSLLLKMIINKKSNNKEEQINPLLTELDVIYEQSEKNKSEMNRVIREINDCFKEMNSLADGKLRYPKD